MGSLDTAPWRTIGDFWENMREKLLLTQIVQGGYWKYWVLSKLKIEWKHFLWVKLEKDAKRSIREDGPERVRGFDKNIKHRRNEKNGGKAIIKKGRKKNSTFIKKLRYKKTKRIL